MGVRALLFGEQLVDRVVAGKYRLVRLVGRGAFGAVYEAQETVAGQYVDSVAVKLCQPTDEDTLAALIREVRALAPLGGEHVESPVERASVRGHNHKRLTALPPPAALRTVGAPSLPPAGR